MLVWTVAKLSNVLQLPAQLLVAPVGAAGHLVCPLCFRSLCLGSKRLDYPPMSPLVLVHAAHTCSHHCHQG